MRGVVLLLPPDRAPFVRILCRFKSRTYVPPRREVPMPQGAIEPYERAAAKERMKEAGKVGADVTNGKADKTGGVKFTHPDTGKARDVVAEAVGMSAPTLAKGRREDRGGNHQRIGECAFRKIYGRRQSRHTRRYRRRRRHERPDTGQGRGWSRNPVSV